MGHLRTIYRDSLGLLTDLYQLTMAYGYWKLGRADRLAVFHLFFRQLPFGNGYAIAAGLETALEYLQSFRIDDSDADYLATLTGNDGQPLFEPAFLTDLQRLTLTCDIDAMREGTICFGQEPLLRVEGPLWQCQLLETPLLNLINFQTLVATKAARICQAARGEPVLEFGLRRAQGIDGGLTASRAAYIGGCAATSNLLAGKQFGIPVKGTHAHSWVMSFDSESKSFAAYAQALPNNCVFLVDTYDSLEGVRRAIEVGRSLRESGHEMVGVRLDSGDLAELSIAARRLLDEAGFTEAAVVASNDLDEHVIESLKGQAAAIGIWGVGTKLVTAYDQPALGGVYKLGAIKNDLGEWETKLKRSEQLIKSTIPGRLQVRRFESQGEFAGDMVFDEFQGVDLRGVSVDLQNANRRWKTEVHERSSDLLVPVMRQGKRIDASETLEAIRTRVANEQSRLPRAMRRLLNPHQYSVGLDLGLHEERVRRLTDHE